jgi:hypothetical protein
MRGGEWGGSDGRGGIKVWQGGLQVRARGEAFEIVDARQLLAVEGDVGEAQQQLGDLHSAELQAGTRA